MILEIMAAAAVGWLVYNTIRVYRASRNAVEVASDVVVLCPSPFAFETYLQVEDFYKQLSPGHIKFEQSSGDRPEDAVIEVWEKAGFQFVRHEYRVTELIPDRSMKLLSEKSRVRVLWLFKGVSRSEVEIDFIPRSPGETHIGLKIGIVFPSRFLHLLARMFFTEAIWRNHAREELSALARIINRRYSFAP